MLLVCACTPILKPIYDVLRENTVFGLSYFSSKRYGSNRRSYYGFDTKSSSENPSHSDLFDRSSPNRISNAGKVAGASTKVTVLSDTELDLWNYEDKNALIGMGDINVQRGWEVHSGRGSNSESISASYPAYRPAQFETKKVRGDGLV